MGPRKHRRVQKHRGRRLTSVLALCAMVSLCGVLQTTAFASLELFTDNRSLFFGLMKVGEHKTLSDSGSYHNQVICASTGEATWYLKVNLLQPLTSGGEQIPLEHFTWQLSRVDGNGRVAQQSRPRSFSLSPDLVYLSGPGEASGTPVTLKFQYSLTIPEAQVAGVYQTTIRFTMTEIL